jgi:hypothetical protein
MSYLIVKWNSFDKSFSEQDRPLGRSRSLGFTGSSRNEGCDPIGGAFRPE